MSFTPATVPWHVQAVGLCDLVEERNGVISELEGVISTLKAQVSELEAAQGV